MTFSPVAPEVMQAAQILTGTTMAAWLMAGFFPRHGARLRAGVLVVYLAGVVGFLLYTMAG